MRKSVAIALVAASLAVFPRIHAQTSHAVLKKIAEFDLPGLLGKRFDYLTIDPADHYLISTLWFAKTPAHREINNIAAAISPPFCYKSRPWCVLKDVLFLQVKVLPG
jgi:hypothetical protein